MTAADLADVKARGTLRVIDASAVRGAGPARCAGASRPLHVAERTDRDAFGWLVPASWFQSASPLFLLIAAPLLAVLWLRLGARVHAPAKVAAGLALTGSSFAVLVLDFLLSSVGYVFFQGTP